MMRINHEKLEAELRAAGVPIDGVATWGEIHFRDEATAAHRSRAQQILAAHDPAETLEQKRRDINYRRQEWLMCTTLPAKVAYLAMLHDLEEPVVEG